MKQQTILLNNRTFFYRMAGSGPAVVLLHGFGETGDVWQAQGDALQGYQVLVPDLPGSGKSDRQDDSSMEALADTLAQWLQEMGVQKCVLIGHSMGGYIAMAFAEKFPALLRALGLFHSTAAADGEEKKEARRKGIAFMEAHGAGAFLATSVPNMYAPANQQMHPDWITHHLATTHNFSAGALVSYYQAMMNRKDRNEVLARLKVPVLMVAGRDDQILPLDGFYRQTQLPALSYIHVLDHSGHMGMVEESENTTTILRRFLADLETVAAP